MLKKIIGTSLLFIIKKRDKYLLKKFANRLKNTDFPHKDAIHQSVIGVLEKKNKTTKKAFINIEKERLQMSKNSTILVDNSFDLSGLYDEGLTISDANNASKPKLACEFLGFLAFYTSPKSILELGTNVGISSSYMSILNNNNMNFNITTLDASPYRQRVAKTIHKNLGIKNINYVTGLFSDTLKEVLDTNKKWDFVFIDGHHQYKPTLDYFDIVYPYCNKNAIIVFDDITWSIGMRKAWENLKKDTRFLYCVDLHKVGIAILGDNVNKAPKTFNMFQEETIKLF
jgi:predicted O-methyltransferase YrrM